MNLKASFFTLTLFFGVVQMAFSQKDISGTVTDEDGQPLPGVNIVVEDSNKGGQTDFDGNYTIEGVEVGATLNFTFVGFQEQSVEVGDDDTIDVTMAEGSQLDEVVITGFGEEQEKVSSASTDFVKSEDLEKRKTSSALGALQGKAPGVNIRQSTGQPGAEMDINVRGKGTAGSVRPLFIIDGIVAENGLRFIDPGDIDRIDVLKDAASAAIYGARGANGVVLVTTKKGKSGKPKIDINSNIGFQENPKKLDLMNKEQYLDNLNQATENAGIDPLFSEDDRDKFADTDWQDVLFNNGEIKQNHNFRISGGEDDVKYSAGLNYYGQKGIIGSQVDHARFNRISANIKTEFEPIEDRLTVGENLTYSNVTRRTVDPETYTYSNSTIHQFFNAPPIYPVFNDKGEYARMGEEVGDIFRFDDKHPNPLAMMDYTNYNEQVQDFLFGDIYAELKFLNNFSFKTDIGMEMLQTRDRSFEPVYVLSSDTRNSVSSVSQGSSNQLNWDWKNTINYTKTLNDKHNFDVLIGMESRRLRNTAIEASGQDLKFEDFKRARLGNARDDSSYDIDGDKTTYMIYSYFGRLKYNFEEKYLLTATVRRDGSSAFGPKNNSAVFPSLSMGWNIDKESFFPEDSFIKDLKLRASWGKNGNDQFSQNFAYTGIFKTSHQHYHFGTGDQESPLASGASIVNYPNPDLKWESSEQWNVGVDGQLFDNLAFTLDFYIKDTKDWLVDASIPNFAGGEAPTLNGGEIRNKGIEFGASYRTDFDSKDWDLNVGGNIAYNHNLVTNIKNKNGFIAGNTGVIHNKVGEINRVQEGFPIGYFYGYQTDGVFQNQEEIDEYTKDGEPIQPDAEPGDFKYIDNNDDGKISSSDKGKVGDPNPDYYYGLQLALSYKAFDFSVQGNGEMGVDVVFGLSETDRNYLNDLNLNHWHGEGTSNSIPRSYYGNPEAANEVRFSDYYVHNANFFKITSVNLGYDFAEAFDNLEFFDQLRLYVSAQNLYTFTNYVGYDPEVGYGDTPWGSGIDIGNVPAPRIYQVGVQLSF